ncbi:hypothetical protein UF10_08665 [Peptostreptococcus russellii]|uniref:Uncharacterized protein n=1 Tax=Peptostreptococcus russellii TaxID=215200 RepID=A0A2P7PYY6_9FIRM|nr:hypothetical protein [Peptostreptococcus russellii]PSJ30918.1 hypothetical protein UF10_08665 [Peptostreptococcus russellii]
MKRFYPLIKFVVFLTVLIFAFVKIDPFSRLENDPVDILNQDNLAKNVDIDTISPSSIKYSEHLKDKHGSVNRIVFNEEKGILRIVYYSTSHTEGQTELRNFAYQSSDILENLRKNPKIDSIEFSQEISMGDGKTVENAIYAYFDRSNFDSINYLKWKEDIREKDNFMLFFNKSNKYMVDSDLIRDLKEDAVKIMDYKNMMK